MFKLSAYIYGVLILFIISLCSWNWMIQDKLIKCDIDIELLKDEITKKDK